jgi:lysophospholipase L1-like esterase
MPMMSPRSGAHALIAALMLALFAGPWRAPTQPDTGARPGHHRAAAIHHTVPPGLSQGPEVAFETPSAQLPEQPDVASLAIPGRAGTYLVPYIQTQPNLHFRLRLDRPPSRPRLIVTLDAEGPAPQSLVVTGPQYEGTFHDVPLGDHTLSADLYSGYQSVPTHGAQGWGRFVTSAHLSHVARGDIIAAIGDSTTEGLGGAVFSFMPNWVTAQEMAADWTSADGRNFPQAGAMESPRAPASFTSTLGGLLEATRGHPVLVLNDGWSGATAEAYSHIVSSPTLASEYAAAQPSDWLVNLGVNDPLTHQSPDQFAASMHTIVAELGSRFAATPRAIHLACPSWAAQDFRHQAEATYMPVISQIRATLATGPAPNFYTWYRDRPADLADAVHPNAAGYRDMAGLWSQALQGTGSACS